VNRPHPSTTPEHMQKGLDSTRSQCSVGRTKPIPFSLAVFDDADLHSSLAWLGLADRSGDSEVVCWSLYEWTQSVDRAVVVDFRCSYFVVQKLVGEGGRTHGSRDLNRKQNCVQRDL